MTCGERRRVRTGHLFAVAKNNNKCFCLPKEDELSAVKKKNLPEWIAAAEKLALNSGEHVDCPECQRRGLRVRDIEYGWGPSRGLERHVVCMHCGAHNIVNLRHALPCGEVHVKGEAKADAE